MELIYWRFFYYQRHNYRIIVEFSEVTDSKVLWSHQAVDDEELYEVHLLV